MKTLVSVVAVLLIVVIYLVYKLLDQSVTVDHLQMSVKSLTKREACLLSLSRTFVATQTSDEVKRWARVNGAFFDVYEEDKLIIVNEVAFDLSRIPPTVD
jgi:hypothetical protein